MIKTSPSASNSNLLQWILSKLKLWEPVELVEKKFKILKECSLNNKESIKKKKNQCTILSSDEGDMIKTNPSALNSNLLLWIPTELKFLGGLISFPIAWYDQLGKLAMTELQNELHKAQKPIKAKRGPWQGHMKTWVHVTPIG